MLCPEYRPDIRAESGGDAQYAQWLRRSLDVRSMRLCNTGRPGAS
jgi:hypothetical protein